MPNDKIQTALGGETIEITHDGKKEDVLVRTLPLRVILKEWAPKLGDEPALVELYCGKDDGWDDKLAIDSHALILATGEKLNDPTFAAWTERQAATNAKSRERMKSLGIDLPSSAASSSTAAPA